MCGITGIFNYGGSGSLISNEILSAMTGEIAHRGPDDDGFFISPDRSVGFGFRRLSIIDLSPAGHQPMLSSRSASSLSSPSRSASPLTSPSRSASSLSDRNIALVFNGEIYNHLSIRRDLEAKGYQYRSHSDTETLLYAYEEYGLDFIPKLYGMFAVALWDDEKRELLLVRDRLGVKPLYYTVQHGALFFASEIKALLKHPALSAIFNRQGFYDYLTSAVTPPDETLFSGIHKLEAGHFLRAGADGHIEKRQYWDAMNQTEDFPVEQFAVERFCVDHIRRLLRDSIKLRMMSDVPFGVFLSGGIDSSVNVALMSELMTRPVETFSVGYKDLERYNELGYARQVSALFKTNHHEILIDESDALGFLEKMVWHLDEPNADPVCVPLYFVSKLARDSGTVVVQVGEGSDELFSGYTHYLRELFYRRYYYGLVPGALQSLVYQASKAFQPDSLLTDYFRRAAENDAPFYGGAMVFTEEQKRQLLTEAFRSGVLPTGRLSRHYTAILHQKISGGAAAEPLREMIYLELKNRLPELLLMRVDKISMATSIEARVPFLDHRLVEFAFRIPEALKVKHGEPKYILKKAAEGIIPDEIIYRKKQGFAAPVSEWFRNGKLSGVARERIFGSSLMAQGFLNRTYIERLFEKHTGGSANFSTQLWSLLVASMWHDQHFGRD